MKGEENMTTLKDFTPEDYDAFLFDLDGVLTKTAKLHAACWKKMFDEFLQSHSAVAKVPFVPFNILTDYLQYVDGKPRYEGVQSFLASRQIEMPYGDPKSAPGNLTICGLGNRKDQLVKEALRNEGVETYEASVTYVRRLLEKGIKTAVVSSSKNCAEVLEASDIADLFLVRVDGLVAADLGLAGKPAPDTFLKATELLGVNPERAVVVEDAIVGVQAGRAGNFGLVIGIARHGDADALRNHGADIVVNDLAEFLE